MALKTLKNKIPVFQWKPLSPKQLQVMTWWKDYSPYKEYDAIIADGSVRAGKTVSMAYGFTDWAMSSFDGCNFALCGKTIGSLRRNVVAELKKMLKGRKYKVEDYRSDNLLIIKKNGRINYFYLFGGKDESSQDLIQGITLAGVFFDEVALQVESFVKQAVARCSVDGAKYWFNCNPDGPYHWFKLEWIDKADIKRVLYLHFTMKDNWSLTEAVRERYERMFSGIFYKRFILGLWVLAEGVIYDMFDEERNVRHFDLNPKHWERMFIAVDYGIQNPMTYGKYGVAKEHYHLADYYYHSGRETGKQKTDGEYADDLEKFIGTDPVRYVTIDPSATSFIVELRKRKFFKDKNIKIIPAKNDVMSGIQCVGAKLQQGTFTIEPHCVEDKREFTAYVWDPKATERGKDEPLKENDHCMDRNRYGVYTDSVLYARRVNMSGKGAQR